MYKIFIVEDDKTIGNVLEKHLKTWGWDCRLAEDFSEILLEFAAYAPHLVLMDISLPFYNGYHWCDEIRKISKVPIIFLSSASDNMNVVMAVSMGGDDFIAKPFDLNVLTAKIQAMLRRTYDFSGGTHLLEHKGAILNVDDGTLTYKEEKLELTKNDFRILRILMENKGKIVSRDRLMEELWATDCFVDENTLTVNMTRLRRKLENIGLDQFIRTKKGVGYLIG
ncbi:MAG TPA: response regulator transcription factor [Candidatus Onthocola gallistercoris]|uniref:Response regulator transcription factor n=1 Tax=Candidatus Onthocola gallistercoris TaxID=2840876 RepID=A0A9D1HGV3_9FIRM|nr:response regulator transcription factor [Candidatus Onthocola gallistercoris]